MKTKKNELAYSRIVGYALLAEFGMIALQWLYIQLHNLVANTAIHFNPYFIKHTGFYVFLIIGFVVFILLSLHILRKTETYPSRRLLTLFLSGTIIEVAFYVVIMGADYDGELLYSVLNKAIGIIFGAIIFKVTEHKSMHTVS